MKKTIWPLVAAILLLCGNTQKAWSLTIIRDYVGGTPPTNSIGEGNLADIVDAACRVWELAIRDDATLIIHYGWAAVGGGQHVLDAQGGFPNRETEGTILLNNNNEAGNFLWFLNPNPLDYTAMNYIEESVDLGAGTIVASRYFSWPTTNNYMDLLTAVLHEIGHGLGMSFGNTSFLSETADGNITITGDPFAGMVVPLQHNNAGWVSHLAYVASRPLMTGSWAAGESVRPSPLDIRTLAQISGFRNLNLDLVPNLNISTPYAVSGVMKVDLSWIQPLPSPQGKRWVVQGRPSMQEDWSTTTCTESVTNGMHAVSVPIAEGNAFFRLALESIGQVSVQNTSLAKTLSTVPRKMRTLDCENHSPK